ncbi:MAG: OmpA family protein [Myxococcales bacterium]|nr:OmpA family protein [Myxococcales bacterium]
MILRSILLPACLVLLAGTIGCTTTVVHHETTPLVVEAKRPAAPSIPLVPVTKVRVVVGDKKIEVNEKIHFAFDSAEILSDSDSLLDEIADVIKAHPEIKKLSVEGHTDAKGAAAYNLKLSADRAASVVAALVERGVQAARLSAKGFGLTKPIETNDTEEGRAANRRVEFVIVERSKEGK